MKNESEETNEKNLLQSCVGFGDLIFIWICEKKNIVKTIVGFSLTRLRISVFFFTRTESNYFLFEIVFIIQTEYIFLTLLV